MPSHPHTNRTGPCLAYLHRPGRECTGYEYATTVAGFPTCSCGHEQGAHERQER